MSVVDYRRALHRIPELDNQLPETVDAVRKILTPLPCRLFWWRFIWLFSFLLFSSRTAFWPLPSIREALRPAR